MWRSAHVLAAACLVAAAVPNPAGGAPAKAAAPDGEIVCTVDDDRATELSGLVSTASGFVAINDGQFDAADIRVFYLDQRCRVTKTQAYPSPARDPEDVAVAPDGTHWVGDIGDNLTSDSHRQTIALWRIPSGGGRPVIYRLSYPDGWHDAEALLFTEDGRPLIITKELGPALLYQPTTPLKAGGTVTLEQVGSFAPPGVAADGALGVLSAMVTSAAVSPSRNRVALRTYAAAYEWDVPDGDLVTAITTGTPRRTDLPNEPQGEALAYTPDGSEFLTLSDEPGPTALRRYARSTQPIATATASAGPSAAATNRAVAEHVGAKSWVGLVAGGGLLLALLGLIGLRRSHSPR